jgi:hypothetical protein
MASFARVTNLLSSAEWPKSARSEKLIVISIPEVKDAFPRLAG